MRSQQIETILIRHGVVGQAVEDQRRGGPAAREIVGRKLIRLLHEGIVQLLRSIAAPEIDDRQPSGLLKGAALVVGQAVPAAAHEFKRGSNESGGRYQLGMAECEPGRRETAHAGADEEQPSAHRVRSEVSNGSRRGLRSKQRGAPGRGSVPLDAPWPRKSRTHANVQPRCTHIASRAAALSPVRTEAKPWTNNNAAPPSAVPWET